MHFKAIYFEGYFNLLIGLNWNLFCRMNKSSYDLNGLNGKNMSIRVLSCKKFLTFDNYTAANITKATR